MNDGPSISGDESARNSFFAEGSSRVVSARGTEDGLILRIDGRSSWGAIVEELNQFLLERKNFFQGGKVSIEWLDRMPNKDQGLELEKILKENFGIEVSRRRKPIGRVSLSQADELPGNTPGALPSDSPGQISGSRLSGSKVIAEGKADVQPGFSGRPLFAVDELDEDGEIRPTMLNFFDSAMSGALSTDDLEVLSGEDYLEEITPDVVKASRVAGTCVALESKDRGGSVGRAYAQSFAKYLGDELLYEEDANAKVIFGTLRSGQRIETPYSLVVVGDVNPGADLIAGGDIIVLGSLRGTAHASAYDDEYQDRVIIAVQMRPMQLRIGSVISRGSDDLVRGVEIAHIEDRRIVVEAYEAKALQRKRLSRQGC